MPSLILIKSPGGATGPQTFPLDFRGKGELVLGREPGGPQKPRADIFVDDPSQQVSRRHAVITTDGTQFFVENASRNGTLLNNQNIDRKGPQPLKPDDRVKVCDFLFRFHDERAAAKQPLPKEFLTDLPDPPDGDGEAVTTVQHTMNRAAAQQFLDVQPTERIRVLLDISTKLSRTLDLEELMPQIADELFGVYRQADRVFVIQLDAAGRLYAKVAKTRRANAGDRFSKTIINNCIKTGQGYLSEDASGDQKMGAAQSIAEFRIRSVMCVPLVASDGTPLGALQLDTQDVSKKFREDDLKLLTIVANLAAGAIEKTQLIAALLAREKFQRDIELGKQVQLGFLPGGPPDVAGYEFFGFYQAAQTIGGDYYDYISLPGGRTAVVLGDVAGKGVPAAMLMAKLSAEARFCFVTETNPARAISLLNNQLVRGGIGERFVTLAACILDPQAHTLTIVNAGHLAPLRYCGKQRQLTPSVSDDRTGLPLGIIDGFEYEMETISLNLGESIVLFTDGVTDSRNPADAMFEMAGVRNTFETDAAIAADARPRVIGDRLATAVRNHAADAPQADDIAMVCFGRVEGPLLSGPMAGTLAQKTIPD